MNLDSLSGIFLVIEEAKRLIDSGGDDHRKKRRYPFPVSKSRA